MVGGIWMDEKGIWIFATLYNVAQEVGINSMLSCERLFTSSRKNCEVK